MKPENITGEWIKQQIEFIYTDYKQNNNFNGFTLNPKAKNIKDKIQELQLLCPHKYNGNCCIYCKKEADNER